MASLRWWQLAAAAVVFSLAAGLAVAQTDDGPFPLPAGLEGNFEFWVRVFAEWRTDQAAVHDLEYPAVVFEVVDLPGESLDRYTDEQKDFLSTRRELWSDFLLGIETKRAGGLPLDDLERRWADHITQLAGEDALAGAAERIRSQRGLRERFRAGLERSRRWDGQIRDIFREAGLPQDLAFLPHVESSFQSHARSSVGASGLWQFTRGTGRLYMRINSAIDERLDPIAATRAAAGYLRDAFEKLESWPLALTSYNHGVQGMSRAREQFGDDFVRIYHEYTGRAFGFASKNFYTEFLAAREIALNADHYFPEGHEPLPPLEHESVRLDRRMTPARIGRDYGVSVDELAAINPAWTRRSVRHGLAIPEGTQVWVPRGTLLRIASSEVPLPGSRANGTVDPHGMYVVQRGDTLSGIGDSFGLPLGRLRQLNGIPRHSELIHVGQSLRLTADAPAVAAPAAAAQTRQHVVRRGDTLRRIASRYRVRLTDLLRVNTLTVQSIIHPGQTIHIPAE